MCRLLWLRAPKPVQVTQHLEAFATICKDSSEYQGHGWGCAWLDDNQWRFHHSITPIWQDALDGFNDTSLFLAHARSAFRDEGIRVENNMPFTNGNRVFIFNGELSGVRIRESGRIGAEKIFNYSNRFSHLGTLPGLQKTVEVIEKRTRYIRAMNLIIATPQQSLLSTQYNENQGYFQMHRASTDRFKIVCSEPYHLPDAKWQTIENRTVTEL